MKALKTVFLSALAALPMSMAAQVNEVKSPDGGTWVKVFVENGTPYYSAGLSENGNETVMIEKSALGFKSTLGDFGKNVSVTDVKTEAVSKSYDITRTKTSHVDYAANAMSITLKTSPTPPQEGLKKSPQRGDSEGLKYTIRFEVSDNNVAFRYEIPQQERDRRCIVINEEATSFNLPSATTTFICPQSDRNSGWMRTKPSYEEGYSQDGKMTEKSRYGNGYTFPCLFHVNASSPTPPLKGLKKSPLRGDSEGSSGWVLISETGVTGNYCASRLSDYAVKPELGNGSDGQPIGGYQLAFPMEIENNGFGSTGAQMGLPANTPWRTITMGKTLKPIVETTVMFDVVEQLYDAKFTYRPGRASWSWIVWQDNSMNYDDQITFAKLAKQMGWEYILVDALWDTQVGDHDLKLEQMFREIQSLGVDIFLWYNSNGGWNDAPQGARHCMDNPVARKKEMAWMQRMGIKGIKVDFFGGDKQETMKLYEGILSDANDYGIQVIFHGCTLPRGWEKMYPNYCASEAVLASENMFFGQGACDWEAFNATLHPFCRNTVGSMDFGGTFLQKRIHKEPGRGSTRRTTDIFQLAVAIVFQSHVQNFALTPYALENSPEFELDFMKEVPTTWDETRFIDGYPTKYVVMARRHGKQWYIAGLNGEKDTKELTLNLPEFANQTLKYYNDGKDGQTPQLTTLKVGKKGEAKITLAPEGGIILMP